MKIRGLQREKVMSAFRTSGRQVEEGGPESHGHVLTCIKSAKLSPSTPDSSKQT